MRNPWERASSCGAGRLFILDRCVSGLGNVLHWPYPIGGYVSIGLLIRRPLKLPGWIGFPPRGVFQESIGLLRRALNAGLIPQ